MLGSYPQCLYPAESSLNKNAFCNLIVSFLISKLMKIRKYPIKLLSIWIGFLMHNPNLCHL